MMFCWYIIANKKKLGQLKGNEFIVKTIVTTEMARAAAEANGLACYDTFTGFKFMAQKKDQLEESGQGKVIFSYEESFGYMMGDYVRDKDAVGAALVLTQMAAWYYDQGMTLYDALQALYKKYGYYGEKTINLVMPGLEGMAKMKALMDGLRTAPLSEIAGVEVVTRRDYADGTEETVATGEKTAMELRGSNVLRYHLADGTDLIVRPSGTEPKVKVYILAKGESQSECDEKVAKYAAWSETLKQ